MSEGTAAQKAALLFRRRSVLFSLAMLAAIWGARWAFRDGLTPPDRSLSAQEDCDVVMLKKGIDASPRLRDTGKWWTGYWIGCNPFWRPLSSYGFWLMWKVFGWEHHDRFVLVTAVCHVAACALLFLLVEGITGRSALALLSLVLLNVRIPLRYLSLLTSSPGLGGVSRWVYIPDVWLAMCVIPALLMAWRGRLWWAIVLASMAAMFKETGFMAFPLVILFYWWRWRRLHKAFWALAGVAALLATAKLVGVGPGWILGSNKYLWVRMFRFAAGRLVNTLTTPHFPWGIAGIGIAVSLIGWRNRWTRYGAIPAAILVASLWVWWHAQGFGDQISLGVAFTAVMHWPYILGTGLACAVWLACAYAGVRGADRSLIILLVLGHLLVGLPATVAPQAGARSFYTASMLASAVSALCVWSLPALFVTRAPVNRR